MGVEVPEVVPMRYLSKFSFLFGVAVLSLAGCSKRADVKTEISDLEKSFKGMAATAPAPNPATSGPAQPNAAEAWVNQALEAARANDYVGSVVALQSARSAGGATPEQLMAVQRTMGAMTSDLAARAARGDAKAKADLAAIERTRSQ